MCLRVGRLTVTERMGGQLRANMAQVIEMILQTRNPVPPQEDDYSAPIVAWFKKHTVVPIGQLLSPAATAQRGPCFDLTSEQQHALTEQFFMAVQPVCYVVDRANLTGNDILADALRSTTFFAASMSLSIYQCAKLFNSTKEALIGRLKASAEDKLSRMDLLSRADIRVFQALTIYVTPQMTSEVSKTFSVFVSMIIRFYQTAGFDKDSVHDTPIEVQTKRHLWQHLLFLNLRAVEAVGPERALIDDELSFMPIIESDAARLAVVRYECYKILRLMYQKREEVLQGRSEWTSFLDLVRQHSSAVRNCLLGGLDDSVPLQFCTKLVGEVLLSRAESNVLLSFQHIWKQTPQRSELLSR